MADLVNRATRLACKLLNTAGAVPGPSDPEFNREKTRAAIVSGHVYVDPASKQRTFRLLFVHSVPPWQITQSSPRKT